MVIIVQFDHYYVVIFYLQSTSTTELDPFLFAASISEGLKCCFKYAQTTYQCTHWQHRTVLTLRVSTALQQLLCLKSAPTIKILLKCHVCAKTKNTSNLWREWNFHLQPLKTLIFLCGTLYISSFYLKDLAQIFLSTRFLDA